MFPDHKNNLDRPKTRSAKILSKIPRSALSGDPIAVTLATNHSIFHEMTLNKVIGAQEGVLDDSPLFSSCLRLNVPNVFALIPQFTIFCSNKERALYDSIFLHSVILFKTSSCCEMEVLSDSGRQDLLIGHRNVPAAYGRNYIGFNRPKRRPKRPPLEEATAGAIVRASSFSVSSFVWATLLFAVFMAFWRSLRRPLASAPLLEETAEGKWEGGGYMAGEAARKDQARGRKGGGLARGGWRG